MDQQDEDQPKKDDNSEDNFGLPDLDYKPLEEKKEYSEPAPEQSATEPVTMQETSGVAEETKTSGYSYNPNQEEETKSGAPVILGLVIVLVVLLAGGLIYLYVIKPRNEAAEKAKIEQLAKDAALKKKAEEERIAKEKEEAERKRLEELANAKPAVGTIETLSAATRRYYVVVSSDIDDDLLMDYAKKLSEKGVSTKIIPPFGGKKFYRLSIADFDTFALAQNNADAAKADYGKSVWVVRF
ncbi:MAG: SPOR domain-containing protein [Bacteroidetes bacterium]|nr:SPOR domain-containing protein [Bacteroidota bacterium]